MNWKTIEFDVQSDTVIIRKVYWLIPNFLSISKPTKIKVKP